MDNKIEIPDKLKKEDFRFVRVWPPEAEVTAPGKQPKGKNWQEENNDKFDSERLQRWLNQDKNYGVVCGFGDLVVIDVDDERVKKAVEENLPKTFKVLSGSGEGWHYYYKCPDLRDPIRMKGTKMGDLGDVQSKGKFVVGPNSKHPSGNRYKVSEDREIAEVKATEIRKALSDFTQIDYAKVQKRKKRESDLPHLDILDVVSTAGLKNRGEEYQGAHPVHGSTTGQNFCVNPTKNVWHCFRHDTGGGPWYWLAVKHGIINCGEATPGTLRGKKFNKVKEVAIEEGLVEEEGLNHRGGKFTDSEGDFNPTLMADTINSKYEIAMAKDTEEIYVYDDGIYHKEGEGFIKSWAYNHYKDMTRYFAKEVVDKIRYWNRIDRGEFNPKEYICLKNGVYDLEEDKFKTHNPDIIFTSKLPVQYNSEADCPNFKRFLDEVLKDKGAKKIIQEMFGYCLWKSYPYRKALMLWGKGNNGKSVLLKVLEEFLGKKNVSNVDLQDLSKRFTKSDLYGKRANISADLSNKGLYSTGSFKKLTGFDTIRAEEKNQPAFKFTNYAKLLFSANRLPEVNISKVTKAFWDRWIIVEFPYEFVEKGYENDPKLKEKEDKDELLKKLTSGGELSGIFNWALEGLKRLKKQKGFSKTRQRAKTKELWLRKSSPLLAFIEARIKEDPSSYVLRDKVYREYKEYCKEEGESALSKGEVTKKLGKQTRGELKKKRVGRELRNGKKKQRKVWQGLALKGSKSEEAKKKVEGWEEPLADKIIDYLDTKGEAGVKELGERFKKKGYKLTKINNTLVKMKEEGVIFKTPEGKFKLVK